jgi:hypothetical protein
MRPAREPFDWPAFFKIFRFQPVPVWIVSGLLLRPLSRATPGLLRAACDGPAREGVMSFAFVVYSMILPPAAAALVYGIGRKRMAKPHRLMGDLCLVLVLLASAANAFILVRQARANWAEVRSGLHALRATCWK